MKKYFFLLFFCLAACQMQAQTSWRGIVADSVTFRNLPDVYIYVKGTYRVTVSAKNGSFIIPAQATDTLVFRLVGYKTLQFPLRLQENGLFILLAEDYRLLQTVTIRGWRLSPDPVEERTIEKSLTKSFITPKRNIPQGKYIPPSFLYFTFSPIDYFSRKEKERRKLNKWVEEENKTQVFRQLISSPKVKDIMMKRHQLDEKTYLQLVERFNLTHRELHYLTDEDKLMVALHRYFKKAKKIKKSSPD